MIDSELTQHAGSKSFESHPFPSLSVAKLSHEPQTEPQDRALMLDATQNTPDMANISMRARVISDLTPGGITNNNTCS